MKLFNFNVQTHFENNPKAGVGAGLKKSVPGYAWFHKNVTNLGLRLRSFTQKRNHGRFPVTLGYTKT